jgi:hypothetical protein
LFNEPEGIDFLVSRGVDPACADRLDLLGISGIANLLGAIKAAKYYEWAGNDVIFTVSTDSMELYGSTLRQLRKRRGPYSELQAGMDFEACLMAQATDHVQEPGHWDKKRIHNLKYFTWVEQWGKDVHELDRQWSDEEYWMEKFESHTMWDRLIMEFNRATGLIDRYS